MHMVWVIGCVGHGINRHLLSATRQSLRTLNSLTTSWYGDAINGQLTDLSLCEDRHVGDDYFQGVDFVATIPRRAVADLRPAESKDYIVLVTTSYKIRDAHWEALTKMGNTTLVLPFYEDVMGRPMQYGVLEDNAKNFVYNGKESKYTAWPHTEEKQAVAWSAIETSMATSTCTPECTACTYWGPESLLLCRQRSTHKRLARVKYMSARGKLALQWQVMMRELLDTVSAPGEPAVKRQRLE